MAVGGWGELGVGDGCGGVFGRSSHQVVSYHGSLWVLGGYDGGYRNDVWRSTDGVSWVAGDGFWRCVFESGVSAGGGV